MAVRLDLAANINARRHAEVSFQGQSRQESYQVVERAGEVEYWNKPWEASVHPDELMTVTNKSFAYDCLYLYCKKYRHWIIFYACPRSMYKSALEQSILHEGCRRCTKCSELLTKSNYCK